MQPFSSERLRRVGLLAVAFSASMGAQGLLSPIDPTSLTPDQAILLANMRQLPGPQAEFYVVDWNYNLMRTSTRITLNFSQFSSHPDLMFDRTQFEETSFGDFTWIGKGVFEHFILTYQDAVFTARGPSVMGSIWAGSEYVLVWPLGRGRHAVVFPGPTPSSTTTRILDVVASPTSAPQPPLRSGTLRASLLSSTPSNDCSETTLMGVYTETAQTESRAFLGVEMGHFLRHQVDVANLAYRNSGIFTRLKLVHIYQTSYQETLPDLSVDLNWLGNSMEVDGQRQIYAADLVVLVTRRGRPNSGLAGGIGSSPFFIMVSDAPSWVLAHEIGHLQGLVDGSGICDPVVGFNTLMMGGHSELCAGTRVTIPYFTNPILSWQNVPLGVFSSKFEVRTVNSLSCRLSNYEGPRSTITALVGDKDELATPDVPTRSARVNSIIRFYTRGAGIGAFLDAPAQDQLVGFSAFYETSGGIYPTSAKLRMRLKSSGTLPYNDAISVEGLTTSPSEQDPDCIANPDTCAHQPFLPVIAIQDLLGREPAAGDTYEVVLDFARAPVRTRETTGGPGGHWAPLPDEYRDLLYEVYRSGTRTSTGPQQGAVGVVIGDDTSVDWAELTITQAFVGGVYGDMNMDGVVDQTDVDIILGGRGTKAYGPKGTDPRDLDRDGQITVLDARKAALACTYRNCAPKP